MHQLRKLAGGKRKIVELALIEIRRITDGGSVRRTAQGTVALSQVSRDIHRRLPPLLNRSLADLAVLDDVHPDEVRAALNLFENLGNVFAHHADRQQKSTRLNSSHLGISYAVFCLKKKKETRT